MSFSPAKQWSNLSSASNFRLKSCVELAKYESRGITFPPSCFYPTASCIMAEPWITGSNNCRRRLCFWYQSPGPGPLTFTSDGNLCVLIAAVQTLLCWGNCSCEAGRYHRLGEVQLHNALHQTQPTQTNLIVPDRSSVFVRVLNCRLGAVDFTRIPSRSFKSDLAVAVKAANALGDCICE